MSRVMLIASRAVSVPYVKNQDYIGVDRGAYIAMEQGIPLQCAIGDFDSINAEEHKKLASYTRLITLPVQKNETDSEAAIHYAIEQGYEEILLYGCFGGRIDHTMANLYLLMHRGYPLTLCDENNEMKVLLPGKYRISDKFRHLSLLALEDSVISEEGVAYPLQLRRITVQDVYTVSNQSIQSEAVITIHSGRVLLMQSNSK